MFGLGLPELLLILVIGLIFFGPGKLPEIGSALGKSMKEFKQAVNSTETEIKKAGEIAETAETQCRLGEPDLVRRRSDDRGIQTARRAA